MDSIPHRPRLHQTHQWVKKHIPALFEGGDQRTGHTLKAIGDDLTFNRSLPMRGATHVQSPYEQVPIVNAVVSEFAESVASLPLRVWTADPATDEAAQPVADDHPLVELLARPNRWMTWSRFSYAGAVHRKTTGEDLWLLLGQDGEVLRVGPGGVIPMRELAAIWPSSGAYADLAYDELGQPEMWRFQMGARGTQMEAPYWSVISFQDYNPALPFRGLGAVEVVRADLELEWQALRYQDALLRHGGDPGGFLTFEGEPPTEQEQREAQADADQAYGNQNAGKVRVAWGRSPKYTPNPISPKDLQHQELFRHVRQRVASTIGVPLEAIGYHENATYNNITEAHREKWRKVTSYLRAVEDVINQDFLARLDDRQARTFVARFDLSQVQALQEDISDKLLVAKQLAMDTGIGMNEALTLLGIEQELPDGGVYALASNGTKLMEAVVDPPTPPAPAPPAAEDGVDEPEADGEEEEAPGTQGEGERAATPHTKSADPGALTGEADDDSAPTLDRMAAEAARAHQGRRDYFKGYDDEVLEPNETRMRKAARSIIDSYQKAAIKRIRSFAKKGKVALGDNVDSVVLRADGDLEITASSITPEMIGPLLPATEDWLLRFEDAFDGPINSTFSDAIRHLAFEQGIPSISTSSGYVQELIVDQRRILSQRVHENLETSLANAIAKVFQGDESVGTLQGHIRNALPQVETELREATYGEVRANRIARTETGKAANTGRHEQMVAAGTEEIEWISSNDPAVRDTAEASHVQLDGQVTEVGQSFRDGAGSPIPGLTYPHAPGAPAAQVINCRCVARALPKPILEMDLPT